VIATEREGCLKVQLRITKDDISIHTGDYHIVDADSFGMACADAWFKISQRQMQKESSIGALMEHLDSSVLDQLNGANISFTKI
jgi:hypothetical protein